MNRAFEIGGYALMACSLLIAASAMLIDRPALGAQQAPALGRPIALASDALAETIASWEAPPPRPQIASAQPPANAEPHQPAPDPVKADTPARIALPPLRPAMTQALALPTDAPAIPSALLLQQSQRPTARPATQPRRSTRQHQPATPRQSPPQPTAPTRQQAVPAQQGGASSGAATQQSAAQSRPQVNTNQLMSQWAGQLSSCLNRRVRAPSSLRGGGQVLLSLQIGRNGAIQGVGIARSSGNQSLDQAAVTAASRVGRCPAAPRGLDAASYSFQLPINLR